VLTPDVLAFVRSALPAPPARVLEVGAGGGELAAALREAGWDVVAIDPAGEADGVEAVALDAYDAPVGSFDAAVAVLSLHHVDPLAASCAHLGELVRPGGALVVDEIDSARVDERAVRWWLERRSEADEHDHDDDPARIVADLRAHVHPLTAVRAALAPGFALGPPVRGLYLHRWHLPPGHRDAEEALVARGELPATGARLVGVRR
jgi:SAM-dependent methyltransferase